MKTGKTREGYRKMLVAIDGSESGFHALTQSFRLAEGEKSWITALCVVPPYEGDLDLVGIGEPLKAGREFCLKALERASELAEEHRVYLRTVTEEGIFHERILEQSEELNSELIVMGRRGRSRLERSLLGSTTARVIGFSRRDVLVIPQSGEIDWRTILVATDGSPFSERAIDRAIDFAEAYGGRVKAVSVVDLPPEYYAEAPALLDKMVEKARQCLMSAEEKGRSAGLEIETFLIEGPAHEGVIRVARETGAGTIVTGSHGKGGVKRVLMGSVTEKVVGLAETPVLVVM